MIKTVTMSKHQISDTEIYSLISDKNWMAIVDLLEAGKLAPNQKAKMPFLGNQSAYYLLPVIVEAHGILAAQKLLENGANPNQRYEGQTSLHIACESNDHEAFELLLNAGADLEQTRSYLEGEGGETALMLSAENCDIWAVQALLKKGANPSAITNKKRQNAVWFATSTSYKTRATERVAVIRSLVEGGCKLVGTELHWPVFRRDAELVKL